MEQEVTHVVRAAREIILSAGKCHTEVHTYTQTRARACSHHLAPYPSIVVVGAIGSPQLLLLSGVGPKEHLEEMGVPVVRALTLPLS